MEEITFVDCEVEEAEIDETELRGEQLNDDYTEEVEDAN